MVALSDDSIELRVRLVRLKKQVVVLREIILLLLAWKGVVGPLLNHRRFEAPDKRMLLTAIWKARRILSLKAGLAILGLRPGRYHAWVNREQQCQLDDRPSCAMRRPGRLSFEEVRKMGDMVLSLAHIHMSIRTLALHAQRTKQSDTPSAVH